MKDLIANAHQEGAGVMPAEEYELLVGSAKDESVGQKKKQEEARPLNRRQQLAKRVRHVSSAHAHAHALCLACVGLWLQKNKNGSRTRYVNMHMRVTLRACGHPCLIFPCFLSAQGDAIGARGCVCGMMTQLRPMRVCHERRQALCAHAACYTYRISPRD